MREPWEGPVLCGSVDARRAGKYMAEVRTSSQCERPCAGIEETRKPPGDAGGSSSPVNGDDHTGKRLAGKPHEPFERADGGRAKARPPPTLQRRSRRTTTGDRPRSWWSKGRGPRGTRVRTARAGLRAGPHAPGSGPGKRVTGAGPRTARCTAKKE